MSPAATTHIKDLPPGDHFAALWRTPIFAWVKERDAMAIAGRAHDPYTIIRVAQPTVRRTTTIELESH